MYSSVIYDARYRAFGISEEALAVLAERGRGVEMRSCLAWGEHCTECVWPSCYATCALYTPRSDLKCRRFARGIEPLINNRWGIEPGFAVSFRTWGKLEAEGLVRLSKASLGRLQHRLDQKVARVFDLLPIPFGMKVDLTNTWNKLKSKMFGGSERIDRCDVFAVECYNQTQRVSFRLRVINPSAPNGYFESHFSIDPGYNFLAFGVDSMLGFIDLDQIVKVQIEPVDQVHNNSIIFTLLDFVRMPSERQLARVEHLASRPSQSSASATTPPHEAVSLPKVKCVVWDLDNTIWNGILIEDGVGGIELRPEVPTIVAELDRRGILQSVASKNDHKEAVAALERYGLMDYFVFPQIGWFPKSQSVSQIANLLNINTDTFVFIDDQIFEREEVRSGNPDVRVVNSASLEGLLERDDFDVPITAEGSRRRVMYQEEEIRASEFNRTNGNFLEFLRESQLKLVIEGLDAGTIERAFELTQRTNQLNYAGRQVSRSELHETMILGASRRGLVLRCADRFGDYGIVGFAIVAISDWTIEDFFMSCRVQRKKVENALMAHLVRLAKSQGSDTIRVRYRPTKRNGPSLEILDEMKFERAGQVDEYYIFVASEQIPHANVVEVEDRTEPPHRTS